MKIELKNLKYQKENSRETHCFSAELWVDGKLEGMVRNDGGGGSHRWDMPLRRVDEIDAWCRTLPVWKDPDDGISLPMNLEFFVSLRVGRMLDLKDARKARKYGRTVFRTAAEPGFWQPVSQPCTVQCKEELRKKYPDIIEFLNDRVDDPKALDIYAGQEKEAGR